jgi:hypothetical protein
VVQIIITILSSAVKFAFTFPLAVLQFKFSFAETILWTNIGGLIGVYFFAFLSKKIIAWWNRVFFKGQPREKDKKIFTRRNRRIVRIKQDYGLIGIAFTTPLLLSIPVGVFLVVRYYRHSRVKFAYLLASNLFWSVIFTIFYMFWDGILFKRG